MSRWEEAGRRAANLRAAVESSSKSEQAYIKRRAARRAAMIRPFVAELQQGVEDFLYTQWRKTDHWTMVEGSFRRERQSQRRSGVIGGVGFTDGREPVEVHTWKSKDPGFDILAQPSSWGTSNGFYRPHPRLHNVNVAWLLYQYDGPADERHDGNFYRIPLLNSGGFASEELTKAQLRLFVEAVYTAMAVYLQCFGLDVLEGE